MHLREKKNTVILRPEGILIIYMCSIEKKNITVNLYKCDTNPTVPPSVCLGDGAKGKRSKKKHKKKKIGNDDEEEEEAATVEEEASDEETSTDLSHMNGTNHERIPLSTSLGTTSTCATSSNVEIVTFQDPLKNRLKRAVEPEAKVSSKQHKLAGRFMRNTTLVLPRTGCFSRNTKFYFCLLRLG